MSNNTNELVELLNSASLFEKKKQEVIEKRLELDSHRLTVELDRVKQEEKELGLAKNANFGLMSQEQVSKIILDSEEYMEAARNKTVFINEDFEDSIPYFRKNLITIMGSTSNGKSTVVSNIVRSTIAQKNPNGTHKTVLVITNEQLSEDFYNATACQIKGWEYVNHHEFTDEQREFFKTTTQFLAGTGLVTVIDNNYNGSHGVTTSIEGIAAIFDNLIATKQYYDVVLIDYYQNIFYSKQDPKMDEFRAQRTLCKMLDVYKNSYPAPIVLLAQSKSQNKDESIPYKFRIEGTKLISNVSTCVVEIVADRDNLRTEWTVHKSRFQKGVVNKVIWTGYEKGVYVPYNDEFKEKVQKLQEKRGLELMNKISGIEVNTKIAKDNK